MTRTKKTCFFGLLQAQLSHTVMQNCAFWTQFKARHAVTPQSDSCVSLAIPGTLNLLACRSMMPPQSIPPHMPRQTYEDGTLAQALPRRGRSLGVYECRVRLTYTPPALLRPRWIDSRHRPETLSGQQTHGCDAMSDQIASPAQLNCQSAHRPKSCVGAPKHLH